jgi:hypothetical protein
MKNKNTFCQRISKITAAAENLMRALRGCSIMLSTKYRSEIFFIHTLNWEIGRMEAKNREMSKERCGGKEIRTVSLLLLKL